MKRLRTLATLIFLSLVLIACQGEAEPTVLPEPVEAAATDVPEPTTEPTAVPEPTEEPEVQTTSEEAPPQPTDRPVVEPPSPEVAGILPMDHFYIDGTAQHGGQVDEGQLLSMRPTNLDIVYTLDGSDPSVNGILMTAGSSPSSRAVA